MPFRRHCIKKRKELQKGKDFEKNFKEALVCLRMNEPLTINDEGYDNYGLMRMMGRVATCDFTFQNQNHMLGLFVNFYFIYFLNFILF